MKHFHLQYLEYWEEIKDLDVEQMIAEYGEVLQEQGLPISKVALDKEQSKFFKTVYINSDRVLGR